MQQTGVVTEVINNRIKIKILRPSACSGNCSECGACSSKNHLVEAENQVGAKIGDEVLLDMTSNKVINAAFLTYILPLLMLVLGYYIGIVTRIGEGFSILMCFIFMVITFFILHLYDKRVWKKYEPVVVALVKKTENNQ